MSLLFVAIKWNYRIFFLSILSFVIGHDKCYENFWSSWHLSNGIFLASFKDLTKQLWNWENGIFFFRFFVQLTVSVYSFLMKLYFSKALLLCVLYFLKLKLLLLIYFDLSYYLLILNGVMHLFLIISKSVKIHVIFMWRKKHTAIQYFSFRL